MASKYPIGIGARRQGATHRVRVASLKSIVERFVYFRRHLRECNSEAGYAARLRAATAQSEIENY